MYGQSPQNYNDLKQRYPPPPPPYNSRGQHSSGPQSSRAYPPPPSSQTQRSPSSNYYPPPPLPPQSSRPEFTSRYYPPPPIPPQNSSSQPNGYYRNQSSGSQPTKYYPPPPSDHLDSAFTTADLNRPNPKYPQPPNSSANQPSTPVPYGVNTSNSNSDFYLHVHPIIQQRGVPDFKLSNCKGRKKALLIGINYFNTKSQLNGCINDVMNIKQFLISLYGFKTEDMVILTDDQPASSKFYPTRANILTAMQWLVSDSQPNDSFFFHYSGHGGRVRDLDGDEEDGYDETIYPVDHAKYPGESGQIIDDLMHDIMVKPLCEGCRLTCIFDSCHSGTALDLPFVYSTKGTLKDQDVFKDAGKGLLTAGLSYASGNKARAITSLLEVGKGIMYAQKVDQQNKVNKFSAADVIMFSGCKDNQTSADTMEDGAATGAMSHAFTTTLRQNPNQSYLSLLNNVRDILRSKYSQRPQLSASHPIDVNLQFVC